MTELLPLSDEIRALLDEITEALATSDVPPTPLLERLQSLWLAQRPGDNLGLEALLASLQVQVDPGKLAQAEARLQIADVEARRNVVRIQRTTLPGEMGEPTRAGGGADGWSYPVYFGTNREAVDATDLSRGFSAHRSNKIRYGRCDVWIPATHRFGSLGTPWWRRWARLQFRSDHLVLQRTQLLNETNFWSAVRSEMDAGGDDAHGLVYLHGYNVGFEAAALRAAQIGFDLKVSGATGFFSWPSQGTLRGYPADAAAIEASEEAIARFLARFARDSGAKTVHLVAHSMGNRGLLRALQRLSADAELQGGVRFGQIFLAAPDVDRDLFVSLAALYPQFAGRTTLYASDADKAVAASSRLYNAPRAGYYQPVTVAAGLDTICVPDLDIDLLGHSYYAEAEALLYDMNSLMRSDAPPNARPRLLSSGDHWQLRR